LRKKILIVGGTGFIGYHLAKKSLEKKWDVTSISSGPPKRIRKLKKVKYIKCDITKKNILKKKIKTNFDYVVNLGGYVDHTKKEKTFKSHYRGCRNLAEIFLKKNLKTFIQMGSSVEYGNSKSPQKEIMRPKTILLKSIYGKAKLMSSNYLIKLYKDKNFPVTILRLYLAFGPKQDINRFIPIIINSCIKNKKFPCSEGKQFRDFIYIDDVINAIFKCLDNKNARGEIFNIGSGKPKKIKNIIQKIKKIIKKGEPEYGKIKLRKDEILKLFPSIKKIQKKLNWKPNIPFDYGLRKTIRTYYEKN
tara:strand:- start:959 stop:1870 length:912 start_codon:yes stop_codon:yes gene_type:complete